MTISRRTVLKGMIEGLGAASLPAHAREPAPLSQRYDRYRIWDVHSHLGPLPGDTPEARIEVLVRHMDKLGIERLILSQGFEEFEYHPSPEQVRQENDRVMQAVRHFPDRAWIYRMAFELGRHIIGYEVQKVLAAIDWFSRANQVSQLPIGVIGYGEGGLIAFHSAALDSRIHATAVSGYFEERENLWKEPLYRNTWGLTRELGDAEIASIIAPRVLIIEACRGPEVEGPPPATSDRPRVACQSGKLTTPPVDSVQREAGRTRPIFAALGAEKHLQLEVNQNGQGLPGADDALKALLAALSVTIPLRQAGESPRTVRHGADSQTRLHSQFDEMVALTQGLVQKSPQRRAEFWSHADTSSPERWTASTKPLRDYIWDEIFGKLSEPNFPINPRTSLVYDTTRFTGYEVTLDLWPDVFDYGILLLPKNIRAGERALSSSASTVLKLASRRLPIRILTVSSIVTSPSVWPILDLLPTPPKCFS